MGNAMDPNTTAARPPLTTYEQVAGLKEMLAGEAGRA